MKDTQEMKESLLRLADNLDESNGVIVLQGTNSANSKEIKVDYYNINTNLALSVLLGTAYEVYVSSLKSIEENLKVGSLTEEDAKELNKLLESMVKNFNSLQKEVAEESYACRNRIVKSLEKEN